MEKINYLCRCAVLNGVKELVSGLNVNPYHLLDEVGLPRSAFNDDNLLVPTKQIMELFELASKLTGEDNFGLKLGSSRNFATLGTIGLIMREQPTVRHAIGMMLETIWTHIQGISLVAEDDDSYFNLTIIVAPGLGVNPRHAIESSAASLTRIIQYFLGPNWRPEAVGFTHNAPTNPADHKKIFGSKPIFANDHNTLILKSKELNVPIPNSSPSLGVELTRYLSTVVGDRHTSFKTRAREVMILLMPRGECTSDALAHYFGFTRRTLHRKLAAEGTTFRDLLQEIRIEHMRSFSKLTYYYQAEFAERLGFSSLSAFSRWKQSVKSLLPLS